MANYILMETWCTPLELVITEKIGSLLRLPGAILQPRCCFASINM